MTELLQRVENESLKLGLKINKEKTKLMIVDRSNIIQMTGALSDLETVDKFVYLGSTVTNQGDCETEIRRRIGMAKSAMTRLNKIWRDRNISRNLKTKIVRTLVFPIFLYGAESWTLRAGDKDRVDAFEMWCWRRMLRIPWTARRTNASILQELNITTRLSSVCLERVLRFFGHIARRGEESLEKLIMVGRAPGVRPRGRSPKRWSDQIKLNIAPTLHGAVHLAGDRQTWKEIVHSRVRET